MSFQRFAQPENGVVAQAPTSLGALPVGLGVAQDLMMPVAVGEAFWIGLSVADPSARIELAVVVESSDGAMLDAISGATWEKARCHTVIVPDVQRLAGIRRYADGFNVFTRASTGDSALPCVRLWFRTAAASSNDAPLSRDAQPGEPLCVALRLVDYAAFQAETGLAAPDALDPNAAYKGWRLP